MKDKVLNAIIVLLLCVISIVITVMIFNSINNSKVTGKITGNGKVGEIEIQPSQNDNDEEGEKEEGKEEESGTEEYEVNKPEEPSHGETEEPVNDQPVDSEESVGPTEEQQVGSDEGKEHFTEEAIGYDNYYPEGDFPWLRPEDDPEFFDYVGDIHNTDDSIYYELGESMQNVFFDYRDNQAPIFDLMYNLIEFVGKDAVLSGDASDAFMPGVKCDYCFSYLIGDTYYLCFYGATDSKSYIKVFEKP